MKLSLLFLCSCAALTAPALAQDAPTVDAPPALAPKFSWKLRLTRGQKWTQTLVTRMHMIEQMPVIAPGGKPSKFEFNMTQTTGFKNEVTEATPAYYLVHVTYTGLKTESAVKIDGKTPPGPAPQTPQLDYAGLSFTLKQAPDGRVLDVIGLDEFIARQKKMLDGLSTTPGMASPFGSMMPSADAFKSMMKRSQSVSVPPHPLSVGESYSYAIDLPLMGALKFAINGKRTLLSFDAEKAVFGEGGIFSVPSTQMFGPTATATAKQVTLTGDAARLYLSRKYRATPTSQPTYLSKNGNVYYREAGNPHNVIWLTPPASGIKLSPSEAEPYRNVRGFNSQTSGKILSAFYAGGVDMPVAASVPQLPKMFMTMNGTQSGQSTLDAVSGLTLKSDVTQTINGKMTIVDAQGSKKIIPLTATSQITSSIQKD